MEDKLNELLILTKENNKILRGMRRSQKWSSFFNFIYYALIIGSIFGSYYYLQPYVNSFMETYRELSSGIQGVRTDITEAKNIALPPGTMEQLKNILQLE
jgi:hypothetical protein